MLSYLLAVLAACANATSSVLQRKANRKVPRRLNLSWRLIRSLLHQPVWFGGIAAICVGFLLQATALGEGQLSMVEPILILELPLTLILASRVFGQRMRGREWGSAVAMTAGLGALLYLLQPSAGRSTSVRWYVWLIGLAAQPGMTLADPVLSVLWGVLAFHEKVRAGWFAVPEVISLAIVAAAVIALARSPLLAESDRRG